jgi:nitrate reductase beta subunit
MNSLKLAEWALSPDAKLYMNNKKRNNKSFNFCRPRVEAGKNTSTVIPASRKGRRKGNPVVLGETVPADPREG